MAILISVFPLGYHGKTVDCEKHSPCRRTTVAHFLNKGKWDDARLEDILKSTLFSSSIRKPGGLESLCSALWTIPISSKTKPSSWALHPIEDTYFHQSHLKGKQDYRHQAVAVMLSCNGIDNAVVLISYPKGAFHVSLSTYEILDNYVERWPVEVFFREAKDKLAFDRYQVRSSEGIRRYWLLMSLAHLIACTGCGETMSFEEGYAYIYSHIQEERLRFIYQCGAKHIPFEEVLALVA